MMRYLVPRIRGEDDEEWEGGIEGVVYGWMDGWMGRVVFNKRNERYILAYLCDCDCDCWAMGGVEVECG